MKISLICCLGYKSHVQCNVDSCSKKNSKGEYYDETEFEMKVNNTISEWSNKIGTKFVGMTHWDCNLE